MRGLARIGYCLVALSMMLSIPRALSAEGIGIVLIHGKQGSPDRLVSKLANAMRAVGYKVDLPDMCWSNHRIYDLSYSDCFHDIDASIERLKSQGATAIVVGGHSLGGNATIGYGATHQGLLGLIGLAPAHNAAALARQSPIAESIKRAQDLVAQGKGDERTEFTDGNTGRNGSFNFEVTTTAKIYLSFFGPETTSNMETNVTKLTAPMLWVAGDKDPTQRRANDVFHGLPANPLNRFVLISAPHLQTPDESVDVVLPWLKELAQGK